MYVLMVVVENDVLLNVKVGGVVDVVRDCFKVLVDKGFIVDVVIFDYGFYYFECYYIGVVYVLFVGYMQ